MFVGAEGAGLYNIASITSKIILLVAGSVSFAILPISSKISFEKNRTELISMLVKGTLIFILPLTFGFLLVPDFIIKLFYTAKYIPSIYPFMILSIGMTLLAISSLLNSILWSQRLEKETAKISAVSLLIQLVLLVILVPSYGIIGAAISTTITGGCVLVMSFAVFLFALDKKKIAIGELSTFKEEI
jgi:O-antigen/teichoic acid export membrane protein